MRQRNSKVLSFDEQLKLWRDLEEREFTPEEESRLAAREDVESRLGSALSTFGRDGWDFQIDHFGPPRVVVRVTLMNRELHRCDVIEALLHAFDEFEPFWILDLGFVDAIEDGAWSCCEDVGRLIATPSEFLLDSRLAEKSLRCLQPRESS